MTESQAVQPMVWLLLDALALPDMPDVLPPSMRTRGPQPFQRAGPNPKASRRVSLG
jgi:hypothetical protein